MIVESGRGATSHNLNQKWPVKVWSVESDGNECVSARLEVAQGFTKYFMLAKQKSRVIRFSGGAPAPSAAYGGGALLSRIEAISVRDQSTLVLVRTMVTATMIVVMVIVVGLTVILTALVAMAVSFG